MAVGQFQSNFRPIRRSQRVERSRKHQSLFHSHVPTFVVDEVAHDIVHDMAHKILVVQDGLNHLRDAAQTPCSLLMLGFEIADSRRCAGVTHFSLSKIMSSFG